MWTTLAQTLLGFVSLGLLCLIKRARGTRCRAALIVSAILALGGTVFLGQHPIENAVYTFPTAEEAAKYASQGEILALKHADHSSLALYAIDSAEVKIALFPKTADGYKLGDSSLERGIATSRRGAFVGKVLYCQGDHYAFVMGATNTTDTAVLDSCGSDFETIVRTPHKDHADTFSVVSVAVIRDYDENYSITLTQNETPTETLPFGGR